jgi:hypothetical protein
MAVRDVPAVDTSREEIMWSLVLQGIGLGLR